MAREINRLNARRVAAEKRAGRHADGGGLYLSISPNGGRRWVFLFKRDGKAREMGLGSATAVSLGLARELAGEARAVLARGADPIAEKEARERAARAILTFGQCAELFIDGNAAGWKNAKHRDQWRMTLLGIDPKGKAAKNDYCKPIRDLPVSTVDTAQVLQIIEPIWAIKTETASRLRGRIEGVLDWARARGHRQGENPALWRGHLDKILPKRSKVQRVRHHPAIPYPELPAFMADLRAREGVSALALEFTILTAARTGAVIGATISEFDISGKAWTVSPERAGSKISGDKPQARRVPLSPRALEIVEIMLAIHGPKAAPETVLVPGEGSEPGLSNNAMLALLERMGRGNITTHGFRSSFKDWCSETTNYPGEVSEAALWHAVADKVEAAYRRGDLFKKRMALMNAWASYCGTARTGSVVPIGAGRAAG